MAGFRKAKAEQAALKIGIYGASGRGKTFTALTMAEGLAMQSGKRVAFVDTERGTDFYAIDVKDRICHPKAFDFDAIYTRSITDIMRDVRSLNPDEHGVLIIDSITHVWEAARNAYNGKVNKNGQLPMHAWGKIKKPYKELMAFLLSTPMHVFILGREGTEFADDEETGETKAVGKKMKAEGETAYEPHILMRMVDPPEKNADEVWAYVEKDRTGLFRGKHFCLYPNEHGSAYDLLASRWLSLLGGEQGKIESEDDSAGRDAEAIAAADAQRTTDSATLLHQFKARLSLAMDSDALKAVGKEITPPIKKRMTTADVAELRTLYQAREEQLAGRSVPVAAVEE